MVMKKKRQKHKEPNHGFFFPFQRMCTRARIPNTGATHKFEMAYGSLSA